MHEVRRVLKPGGRVLVVDFGPNATGRRGLFRHFRVHRHGHVDVQEIIGVLTGARLNVVESGAVGTMNLHFVLAVAPDDRLTPVGRSAS
jgi:hypothetical protein